ncbi:MAG: SUMF1/EgtB/PvdO family nonheme iron enzyme [Planctomycetaceae bacterium]
MPPFSARRRRITRRTPLAFQQLEPRLAMATIDPIFVPVSDAGNAADPTTGYGRVGESYRIGKYEVTIGEYAAFLNAVAADDPAGLYHPAMASDATSAGILRAGTAGTYTYTVTGPAGISPVGATSAANRPIAYVDWFDAARFANWMANGQQAGPQGSTTTENGVYDLSTAASGTLPRRNEVNPNTGAAPSFFLPSENQWYKAAYYDPALRHGRGGYYRFATRSNATPGNVIGDAANHANYIFSTGTMTVTQQPEIMGTQNYLTNVGAMRSSPSSYGTFDQNGNVWELTESAGMTGGAVILRGGAWTSFSSYLSSGYRLGVSTGGAASNAGFRLAALPATAAPVVVDLVTVGDAGNAADAATGFGSVSYAYAIARTGVTVGQYTAFLNAVAKSDPKGLYDTKMATDLAVAGINRAGTSGRYSYSVINNDGSSANRPITYVSWFDAARFANWISNGQPRGGQNVRTTENGAYNLAASNGRTAVPRNAINPNTRAAPAFFIPTENEWYKSAYFSPAKSGGPGYYLYATQQDVAPANNPTASGVPVANYLVGPVYCVTQSAVFSPTQNYLTDAGQFSATESYYGTLDQNGNVYQWNDLAGGKGLLRGLRGGFWAGGAVTLQKSTFTQVTATRQKNDAGFRLVSLATTQP